MKILEQSLNTSKCITAFYHGDFVTLHMIGTAPDYRGKRLGYAVTHRALMDAKRGCCKGGLLLASEMRYPLYIQLGFKEYVHYAAYGNY